MHFYTATVGEVFFEVVQRNGGYDGYGAANAPVRLAASAQEGPVSTPESGGLEAGQSPICPGSPSAQTAADPFGSGPQRCHEP